MWCVLVLSYRDGKLKHFYFFNYGRLFWESSCALRGRMKSNGHEEGNEGVDVRYGLRRVGVQVVPNRYTTTLRLASFSPY